MPVIRTGVYPHMPITVTTFVKNTFWQCIKDKILLKIVFEILLSNAFDFTRKIHNTFIIYFKLENVAIAGHCNLRPPGLPPDPSAHASEKLSCPKTALGAVKICVKFQTSSSNSFRDTRGSKICTRGRCTPARP